MLPEREENEAFCLAAGGEEYAIFFIGGGGAIFNGPAGGYKATWLQIRSSHWG